MNVTTYGEPHYEWIDVDDLLSAKDLMHMLGISKSEAYKIINRSGLRTIKVGRSRCIKRGDLEEFWDAKFSDADIPF